MLRTRTNYVPSFGERKRVHAKRKSDTVDPRVIVKNELATLRFVYNNVFLENRYFL